MDERLSALIAALSDEETRADGLAELSDEQLTATRDELLASFRSIRAGEVEDVAADDVDALGGIHAAIQVLNDEHDVRETAAAERAEAVAAMEASLEGDDDGENDGGEEAPAAPAEPEAPAETPAPGAEPVAVEAAVEAPVVEAAVKAPKPARRSRLTELAARIPEQGRPQPGDLVTRPRFQLVNGTLLNGREEINERFAAALQEFEGMGTPPGFSQKVSVVKLKTALDEDHHIGLNDDVASTARKIEAVTAAAKHPNEWDEQTRAVVASGGWCAPAEARYEIPAISSAARPVRDGLARMTSSRGSVSFVRAARLSTILANATGAAVTTWENATDQTPGGSTKTRQTHACRTVQTETLGAVAARMRFGNFQQRAFPEDVAADLDLAMARHARVAEVRLMDSLIADVNIDVAQTGVAGTARDVKHHFAQAVSEMRYTERSQANVRAIISDVLLDMIPADVAFQQASGELDALVADEAFARQLLASVRGLSTIVSLDVPSGTDAFISNSDGENLADWPDNFEIPFFYDGTVVFVDGGELDLGIIRDSTLNDTNDYEVFMETFEGLLWLGPYAKTLTLVTCPNGNSQVATSITGSLCSGS